MPGELHALLRRQLRRHFGSEEIPAALRSLIDHVNDAYHQADEDRRMNERAFELSSQELVDANAELGAALDALRKAAEQTEQASRAKDEFLAMLGHELRNPLAPIVTALDLASLGGRSTVPVTEIERPLRHVLRLVDDLLDIARVARGTLALDRRPLDVARAVRNAAAAVQPAVHEARHALEIDLPDGLLVDGDETRLTQVVSNLLINAVRYTEAGGVITVRAHGEAGEVVLQVRDNGRGIEAAALPQIFDSFGKPRVAGAPASPGLGLGLTIVRNMVSLHGGTVTAHSDGPGRGAMFEVRLPALAHPLLEPSPPAPTPRALPRKRKVLVVDDNHEAADMLARALELSGHEVELAYRADDALSRAERFVPDVALLDLGLGDMSGHVLGPLLRELHATVKLIAITGYGQPTDRAASARAGFAAHLVKPVSLAGLLEVIDA
jgi:signal transduction histidine kinase